MPALAENQLVAVVGSGAMGAGIAQIAAAAGHRVKLYDSRPEAVAKAIAGIGDMFGKLAAKGRMSDAEASAASERLEAAATLAELADAALVVEAIVENLDIKRALFAELEALVADDCILATNTSSISVTAIGAGLRLPHRLAGMHFFNPVPLMALVEVVSGLATDAAVADTIHATAAAWGKNPVHAKSTPGFIVNRLARPYYAEGLRLMTEQAGDAATIDAVMREAGAFRMGPFELMDLIGHDVNFSVTQSVFQAYYNDPRFTPSVLQQELVSAGFLGRKSGRGFHRYGANAPAPLAQTEAARPRPRAVHYHPAPGSPAAAMADALARRLQAAGIEVVVTRAAAEGASSLDAPASRRERAATLDAPISHREGAGALDAPASHREDAGTLDAPASRFEGAGLPDAPVFYCEGAAILLTDGRTATERARDSGHPDTVLFDLAFDYASATRIAVSRADQCGVAAWDAALGLLQAAGFAVSRLDDVPGLAVMRTVAMLANEAADAVNQGVCTAAAADIAMQKGVNYPRGPLAWADAVGIAQIVAVLANLAASYGEDRYRVAPLLRRKLANGATFHA